MLSIWGSRTTEGPVPILCRCGQVNTVVRHFFGDIEAMRKELMQALGREASYGVFEAE